jgi:hypothetical protein
MINAGKCRTVTATLLGENLRLSRLAEVIIPAMGAGGEQISMSSVQWDTLMI